MAQRSKLMQKCIQVTSKSAFIHDLSRLYQVNVEYLDRRWWELRPRMRISIPLVGDEDKLKVEISILNEVIKRGRMPYMEMKVINNG